MTVRADEHIPETLSALRVPIDGLKPYGENPRRGNVDVIVESLEHHGQYRPIVVRAKTFEVLAGNHTLAAAKKLGWQQIAATFVDVTDDQAARIVLVDNRSADLGSYDDETLLALLGSVESLVGTGYSDTDVVDLADLEGLAGGGEGTERERAATTGELLSLADLTFGEPKHETTLHDVWRVGRHTLVLAPLHLDHAHWRKYLTDDVVFMPYPETYITASNIAQERTLLLVQPNKFLAGHLLDKHAAMFPDETIERIKP